MRKRGNNVSVRRECGGYRFIHALHTNQYFEETQESYLRFLLST